MAPENNHKEQDRKLEQMDYDSSEDIFNKEKHLRLDGNGNPIFNENLNDDELHQNLDTPESGDDDEENNFWSLSDNEDDHEEKNDDVLRRFF